MASLFGLPPLRSISLPSRLHPTSLKLEAELDKLKTWEASLPSFEESLESDTIVVGILKLAELYNCVEELVHSSNTRESLLRHQNGKYLEEALDGSVALLDTSGCAKDLLLKMKEHVQGLQSSLRRRGGDSSIQQDVSAYTTFRKKARKETLKHIRLLKRAESKYEFLPVLNLDPHLSTVVRVLRELSTMTSLVFRYVLLFVSTPSPTRSTLGRCSLISKLMPVGLALEKGTKINNEIGRADAALCTLHASAHDNNVKNEMQIAQSKLETLACSIHRLESGLDVVFRRLIRYRVSLLNVLSL